MPQVYENKLTLTIKYTAVILAVLLLFSIVSWYLIDRDVKTVTLNFYGVSSTLKLYGSPTVADALRSANVSAQIYDEVSPSLDTPLKSGDVINVEQAALDSGTFFAAYLAGNAFDQIEAANAAVRSETVARQHASGYTYRGRVSQTAVIAENTITLNGVVYNYVDVVTVKATGYCACSRCCGQYANGITADGSRATAGYTVAAPSTYSFGTMMYIPFFDRIFEVEDRGGAITTNRIDVYFNTHQEALNFGVKYIDIYILEKVE